jgi:hypothetical protein
MAVRVKMRTLRTSDSKRKGTVGGDDFFLLETMMHEVDLFSQVSQSDAQPLRLLQFSKTS